MTFTNEIFGGNGVLVRSQIQSPNYAAGTAGWIIRKDGSAEFNNIVARGDITARSLATGVAPDKRVVISSISSPDTNAGIEFYSGITGETDPAAIYSFNNPLSLSVDGLYLYPPRLNDTTAADEFSIFLVSSTDGVPGALWIDYMDGGSGVGIIDIQDDAVVRIAKGSGVSPGSTQHPFQIGPDFGANIRIDGDEIQFANAGAAANGTINQSGGNISFGGQILAMTNFEGGSFTAAATAGGAGATSSTAVSFAHTFPATPRVILTPRASTAGVAALREFGVTGASTTGFTCNINRTDTSTTLFDYIAISGLG